MEGGVARCRRRSNDSATTSQRRKDNVRASPWKGETSERELINDELHVASQGFYSAKTAVEWTVLIGQGYVGNGVCVIAAGLRTSPLTALTSSTMDELRRHPDR